MNRLIFLVLPFIFLTTSTYPQTEKTLLSLKETGIDQYKLALLFAKQGNRERAGHWFRQASFLAYESENTQVPNSLGKKQYQLAQSFWEKNLFEYADYWFQKSAVQTYAAYLPRWRKPKPVPLLPILPQARPYYAGESLKLPVNRTLFLKNENNSFSLDQIQLNPAGEKNISGILVSHNPLEVKNLRLIAYLYDESGKVLKITPLDGYASTVLRDLKTGIAQSFQLNFVMNESPEQIAMISLAIDQIQQDDRLYLTEGSAASHPFLIYRLQQTPPDELGSVSVLASWINTGEHEIKRISFQVEPYTAMGLKKVHGKIRGRSSVWLAQKGNFPFGRNTEDFRWKNVWYNSAIVCIRLTAIEVEFENRRNLRIDQRNSKNRQPSHYFYKNDFPRCPYEE
ncbi:MAG: hypothetical protein HQM13_09175 [SAR324 cluster bacterium]|nr:hypothetical protein [SAR324 cluster bacterium]